MHLVIAALAAITLSIGAFFITETPDNQFGAFSDPFLSYQLATTSLTDGYVLQTDGTDSTWVATSSLGIEGAGTVTSVAQTVPTGWTVSGSPITADGTLALGYDTGYAAVLTASTTNWNGFYNTPSTRITAGDNISWTGNTLNVAQGGSTLHVDGGGYVYPQTGDYHSAPHYVATSTTASSTFVDVDISGDLDVTGDIVGHVIGTDVQAYNAKLASIAGLTPNGEGNMLTSNGLGGYQITTPANVKQYLSLNSVENTALSTWAGSSNLTTLGTIGTGVWNGTSLADAYVDNDITIDLATAATALAANGANCSAGNAPLGVDASGAVEGCYDVWTEAENTAAGYLATVDISDDTNLAGTANEIVLTDDTLSLHADITRDSELAWTDNGTNVSLATPSDRVTIGTTTVSSLSTLTVSATSTDSTKLASFLNDTTAEVFAVTDEGALSIGMNQAWNILRPDDTVVVSMYDEGYTDADSSTAVNYFRLSNNTTGENPTLNVAGSDTNISMTLNAKGTGDITIIDNVGIGTTTAEAELDVWGDSGGKILTLFSDAGTKFMEVLNTGVTTLLGAWDFGGADSVEIVNGANPTTDAAGEVALDTTDNQFIVDDGTTDMVFRGEDVLFKFTMASTSVEFVSGGIVPLPPEKDGFDISQYRCYVDGGTSVVVNVSDGTNDTETITCATTLTSDTDVATNSTFTAGELAEIQIGTITGTPDYLSFTAYGHWTRE